MTQPLKPRYAPMKHARQILIVGSPSNHGRECALGFEPCILMICSSCGCGDSSIPPKLTPVRIYWRRERVLYTRLREAHEELPSGSKLADAIPARCTGRY